MKSLQLDLEDNRDLETLGRASVQVVHDLKNQLNGLKLYATFLRKRMEKSERPADELETIQKLIAGLERAATDMNSLVRYGRPLELRLQPNVDLFPLLQIAFNDSTIEKADGEGSYQGTFDKDALGEAFKAIAETQQPAQIVLRREDVANEPVAICEIKLAAESEVDPFASFNGSAGLRLAMAAKIIRAHAGGAAHRLNNSLLEIRLPLKSANDN